MLPRAPDPRLPCARAHATATARTARSAPSCICPAAPGPHPVIVLIHGGSWHRRYGRVVMRGLAGDLRRRGWAVWNIEYRRLGDGGGWPATFDDVAAAVDHLGTLARSARPGARERARPLRRRASRAVGGGARGAARPALRAPVRRSRSSARSARPAVCDLAGAYRRWRGGVVRALMGGSPRGAARALRAWPIRSRSVPLGMPVLLVHGVEDRTVSIEFSRSYADACAAARRHRRAGRDRGRGRHSPRPHRPAQPGVGGRRAAAGRVARPLITADGSVPDLRRSTG